MLGKYVSRWNRDREEVIDAIHQVLIKRGKKVSREAVEHYVTEFESYIFKLMAHSGEVKYTIMIPKIGTIYNRTFNMKSLWRSQKRNQKKGGKHTINDSQQFKRLMQKNINEIFVQLYKK